MKNLISLMALGLALSMGVAHAADDKAPAKKSKLATCSSEAKGLKGDEYKKKRDECMKSADAAPAASAAASPACEKSAADKKLHGAAKAAHIKKCTADGAAK